MSQVDTEARLARLEERLAWLQRHVAEQDRAMLELSERLDRSAAELRRLRDQGEAAASAPTPAEERPPHY